MMLQNIQFFTNDARPHSLKPVLRTTKAIPSINLEPSPSPKEIDLSQGC